MHQHLTIAILAAREAGRVIMTHYGNNEHTLKIDESPVTAADNAAHDVLAHMLGTTTIPVLSEEDTGVESPYPTQLWIIDPLDGTKDFISGTKDFAVMIALLENGAPTLGVLYAPAHGVLYYAVRGHGAYMLHDDDTEPSRLHVSDRRVPNLHQLASVHHRTPFTDLIADRLQVAHIKPRGGAGIKAALIAEQEGDFFMMLARVGEWDVCAPHIILEEAGGIVTDAHGNPLTYGSHDNRINHGVVFSNGPDHGAIVATIEALFAEGAHKA